MSPTALSLRLLRTNGHVADVVERFVAAANVRKDFLGIGDVLAVRAGESGVLMIQTTTARNLSSRRRKAQANAPLRVWLATGNRFELWGWHQRPTGKWDVKREALQLPDLAAVPVEPQPRVRRARRGERQRTLPFESEVLA